MFILSSFQFHVTCGMLLYYPGGCYYSAHQPTVLAVGGHGVLQRAPQVGLQEPNSHTLHPRIRERGLTLFQTCVPETSTTLPPSIHSPPIWCKTTNDSSPWQLASPNTKKRKRLEEIIGVFLYYGRALDDTMIILK